MAHIVMAYIYIVYGLCCDGLKVLVFFSVRVRIAVGYDWHTFIGISASPTACPLREYGCAGTQNDRLSGHAVGDAEIEPI